MIEIRITSFLKYHIIILFEIRNQTTELLNTNFIKNFINIANYDRMLLNFCKQIKKYLLKSETKSKNISRVHCYQTSPQKAASNGTYLHLSSPD